MLMAKAIESRIEKGNIILHICTHRIVKLCLEEYQFVLKLEHMILHLLKDEIMIESLLVTERDYLKHLAWFLVATGNHTVNMLPGKLYLLQENTSQCSLTRLPGRFWSFTEKGKQRSSESSVFHIHAVTRSLQGKISTLAKEVDCAFMLHRRLSLCPSFFSFLSIYVIKKIPELICIGILN